MSEPTDPIIVCDCEGTMHKLRVEVWRCRCCQRELMQTRDDRPLEAELVRLRAENERLRADLALWKPMTPAEAQAAYDAAEAVPMSDEECERIVKFATDPANRLNNEEETQLWVRVTKLNAEIRAKDAALAAMREALTECRKVHCDPDGYSWEKELTAKVDAALATDAGAALRRLAAAEAVCNDLGKNGECPSWEKLLADLAAWRKELAACTGFSN